jgi:hypothetical protein
LTRYRSIIEAYLHHPAHLAVATTIGERAETALVIDLWHNGLKAKPNDRPNAKAR